VPPISSPATRFIAIALCAVALVVGVFAASCDDGSEPPAPTEAPPATEPPAATVQPILTPITPSGDLGIRIVRPADGATLDATFEVEVAVTGTTLQLGPAGELVPGGAHWHLFLNGELQPHPYGLPVANVGPVAAGDYAITAALYLNDADQAPVAINQVEATVEP
jgi:hypothetical protein